MDHVYSPEDMAHGPGRRDLDAVFECSGDSTVVLASPGFARIMGWIVVVGIPSGDRYSFDASSARRKQLSVVFSRRSNQTLRDYIELVAERKIKVTPFVSKRFPLAQTKAAFEAALSRADGLIRAVVDPTR